MNNSISLEAAIQLTRTFRNNIDTITDPDYRGKHLVPNCVTYDREALDALLAAGNVAQVRIYMGMDAQNNVWPVLVGVDPEGNDILPNENPDAIIMDNGVRCPNTCPPDSPLNS